MRFDENVTWLALVIGVILFLLALVGGLTWYQRSIDLAAINKGLCEATVAGSSTIVWTTCPTGASK
jgi:uncharacterized iron-regulated membrane protein